MNTSFPSATSKTQASTTHIWLFVYGTLQRGHRNHERYCRGALSITPATTWGRLYALPAGYPALVVPEQHILAHGTADPLGDAALQARLTVTMDWDGSVKRPAGDWDVVHGQLIELADPLRSLPSTDRLEGFCPGQPSLYQRVLLPVQVDGAPRLAWTYTMTGCTYGRWLREGVWR